MDSKEKRESSCDPHLDSGENFTQCIGGSLSK